MSVVSNRAIVMWALLAALGSLSLFLQLCVSGCAVGPSSRTPATPLESFHSVGALAARRRVLLADTGIGRCQVTLR
jgi:hypothetical protein